MEDCVTSKLPFWASSSGLSKPLLKTMVIIPNFSFTISQRQQLEQATRRASIDQRTPHHHPTQSSSLHYPSWLAPCSCVRSGIAVLRSAGLGGGDVLSVKTWVGRTWRGCGAHNDRVFGRQSWECTGVDRRLISANICDIGDCWRKANFLELHFIWELMVIFEIFSIVY